jgi:SSS family solute:Na+ symporter
MYQELESGKERSAEDYFLAGRSLPWWAIGASLIAANISAEQIIGMSGQGFVVGYGYSSLGAYCCNCTYSNG